MNLNLTFILQIVSFLILAGLLAKFLYKPLINMLEERSARVARDIDSAKRSQQEAKKYAEETHQALNMAKQEAIKLKEQAHQEADSARRAMLAEARKEYVSIIGRAKKQIDKETNDAKIKLRQDIASASVEIARKILEREITGKDHEKMIDKSIREITDV